MCVGCFILKLAKYPYPLLQENPDQTFSPPFTGQCIGNPDVSQLSIACLFCYPSCLAYLMILLIISMLEYYSYQIKQVWFFYTFPYICPWERPQKMYTLSALIEELSCHK